MSNKSLNWSWSATTWAWIVSSSASCFRISRWRSLRRTVKMIWWKLNWNEHVRIFCRTSSFTCFRRLRLKASSSNFWASTSETGYYKIKFNFTLWFYLLGPFFWSVPSLDTAWSLPLDLSGCQTNGQLHFPYLVHCDLLSKGARDDFDAFDSANWVLICSHKILSVFVALFLQWDGMVSMHSPSYQVEHKAKFDHLVCLRQEFV